MRHRRLVLCGLVLLLPISFACHRKAAPQSRKPTPSYKIPTVTPLPTLRPGQPTRSPTPRS